MVARITRYATPVSLYRYRSIKTKKKLEQELDAITNCYLYCSRYKDLNDPMEGLFSSSPIFRKKSNYPPIKAAITNKESRIGICSFSEVRNHELMWAHYADQFGGICIAYNLRRLLQHLDKNISFARLYYDEKGPVLRHEREEKAIDHLAKQVLSYKNYRWLYEREWRMFAKPGKISYDENECISHIYLGLRLEGERRKRLLDGLRQSGQQIKTSCMKLKKYAITFEAFADPNGH